MSPPRVYRWKNKFVTEVMYKTLVQRSNNGKKRRKNPKKELLKKITSACEDIKNTIDQEPLNSQNQNVKTMVTNVKKMFNDFSQTLSTDVEVRQETNNENTVVEGSRIVDITSMIKQLECSHCKEPLLLQDIVEETIQGVSSIFHIKCKKCESVKKVYSDDQYKNPTTGKLVSSNNTKMVLGAIHSGAGQTMLNKLLSTVDLPPIYSPLFKRHERIVGPMIETVAKESCLVAAHEERDLTIRNIEELKKLL